VTDNPAEPLSFDQLLAIERVGDNSYRVCLMGHGGASFGGQTLGCAIRAAAETAAGRSLHLFHALFLRPVPPETPVDLTVERIRDGRRFGQRRVRVEKDGRLLCEVLAGFASPGEGAVFGDARIDPDVPAPETLDDEKTVARAEGWKDWSPDALQWRWIGAPWRPLEGESSRYLAWVRPSVPPEDRTLHAGALAYLSDFHSHFPVARVYKQNFEPVGFVSLDQSVWLHRDDPWDGWRLLVSECDTAQAGRALSRRQLFSRDGHLIASMAQEALLTG
jgi:acyl-CoA thioesterase-2